MRIASIVESVFRSSVLAAAAFLIIGSHSNALAGCLSRPGTPVDLSLKEVDQREPHWLILEWTDTISIPDSGYTMYYDIYIRDANQNNIGLDRTGDGPYYFMSLYSGEKNGRSTNGKRGSLFIRNLEGGTTYCVSMRARSGKGTNGCISKLASGWACATTSGQPPKSAQKPGPPTADFCNWYAKDAVSQFRQAAGCNLGGASWHTNSEGHYGWCMLQKSVSPMWSEHNMREGKIAECLKQKAATAPPKANQGQGPQTITIPSDVDVFAQQGGTGKPFGTVKKGTKALFLDKKPDGWCHFAGDEVPTPNHNAWVMCDKIAQ